MERKSELGKHFSLLYLVTCSSKLNIKSIS